MPSGTNYHTLGYWARANDLTPEQVRDSRDWQELSDSMFMDEDWSGSPAEQFRQGWHLSDQEILAAKLHELKLDVTTKLLPEEGPCPETT